jgi:valyl-tRNA synthetase
MSDQEFMALLKKFNCEKIEKYDSIKSGDIGLLSSNFSFDGKAKGYEHAFIWDRYPDYLIEKIGSYSSFKLKQTHIKESESWTLFKKECLTEPEKCPLKLTNYRCPYYLAEKPWHGSPSLEEHRKLIDSWIHSNENPLTPDITKTLDELKTIIEEIKKEEKKSTLSLGKIIEKEEAISLLRQVQIFQDPN